MLSPLRFYLSLHFILFVVSSFAKSLHDDRKSLLEFKSLIAKDPQHSMANWIPSNPLCNWTGITCTRRNQMDRVIALNLTAMDLQGPISPSLGNLSFLRTIDLTHNALHGSIPPQLGRLFRLRVLSLPSNQLQGSIPEYGLGGTVSIEGDVYSYGIMLLEMLTRMAPTSDMFVGGLTLHTWVNSAFPSRLKDIIDNSLLTELDGDTFEEDEAYKCICSLLFLGLCCSKDSPKERPTMRDVASMLKSLKVDLAGDNVFSKRPRQCLSNLLGDTCATRNVAATSNDRSSSTF